MRFIFGVLPVFMVFISGCASVDKDSNLIDGSLRCCKDINEITFLDPVINRSFIVSFNRESDRYDFPTGKSLVRSFTIPDQVHTLHYITSLTSAWIPSAKVFIPKFKFFDSNKVEIHQPKYSPIYRYYSPFKSSTITSKYAGTIQIPEGARYFIVFTNRSLIGQKIRYINYEGMAALTVEPVEIEESEIGIDYGITMSGVGSVELKLE